MDPTATWQMLCEALKALDRAPDDVELRAHAISLLEILTRWLRRGGFPPKNIEPQCQPLARRLGDST